MWIALTWQRAEAVVTGFQHYPPLPGDEYGPLEVRINRPNGRLLQGMTVRRDWWAGRSGQRPVQARAIGERRIDEQALGGEVVAGHGRLLESGRCL